MKKAVRWSAIAAVLVAVVGTSVFLVAGAGASTKKKAASGDVCVLFPDPATSIRWVHYDAPAMKAALKASGVTAQIYNAGGDAQKQKAQAEQCLGNGAKVIVEVAIDAGSAAAIEKEALAKGVPSIDYDRQTKGGVAKIYVSFDGGAVGILQGKGVVNGLKKAGKYGSHPVVAEVNGGSTDANSFLFKNGYDSILKPLYKKGTFKKGPDQFVPGWDNQKAGTIFDQMLVKTGNKIDAVAVANDGMAGGVIASAEEARPEADPGDRPGRDAGGLPEHHLRLADDDRLEGHACARQGGGAFGGPADQEAEADDHLCRIQDVQEWIRRERFEAGAGVPHPAGRALQVELDEDLQVRLPQEARHLHRLVQEVLLVGS